MLKSYINGNIDKSCDDLIKPLELIYSEFLLPMMMNLRGRLVYKID